MPQSTNGFCAHPVLHRWFVLVFLASTLAFVLLITESAHAQTDLQQIGQQFNFVFTVKGEASDVNLGMDKAYLVDLDNSGHNDLVIAAPSYDYGSFGNAGALYIIYHSLLERYASAVVDLGDPANYSVKIVGSVAEDNHHGYLTKGGIAFADLDNDGKLDLIVPEPYSDHAVVNRGALYIISNSKLHSYFSKDISLDDPSNYSLRVDGPQIPYAMFASGGVTTADLYEAGKPDVLVSAMAESDSCPDKHGALWILSNSLINSFSTKTISVGDSSNYSLKIVGAGLNDHLAAQGTLAADLDGDGKQDLVVSSRDTGYNSKADSGSVYLIYNDKIRSYKSQIVSLSDENDFSLRIDGAEAGQHIGSMAVGDLDGDGSQDLAIGGFGAAYNGRPSSGSAWLIYGSLLRSLHAKTIALTDETKYSRRLDGPAGSMLGSTLVAGDIDGDGIDDLTLGAPAFNNQQGAAYIVFGSRMKSYSQKNVDLAVQRNSSLVFKGPSQSRFFGSAINLGSTNGLGKRDILIGAPLSAGFVYLALNFPHTITASLESGAPNEIVVSGSVTAPNSLANIAAVQYSIDGNSFAGAWKDCADDAALVNRKSVKFTCRAADWAAGSHTMYLRAYDDNFSYTAQTHYPSIPFVSK